MSSQLPSLSFTLLVVSLLKILISIIKDPTLNRYLNQSHCGHQSTKSV